MKTNDFEGAINIDVTNGLAILDAYVNDPNVSITTMDDDEGVTDVNFIIRGEEIDNGEVAGASIHMSKEQWDELNDAVQG